MCQKFQAIFGVPLDDYWIDNAHGLDVDKFNKEVAHSTQKGLLKAVTAKWGRDGRTVVKRLLPKQFPRI